MYESVRRSFKHIMIDRDLKMPDLIRMTGYSRGMLYRFMEGKCDSRPAAEYIADALHVALVHYKGENMIVEDFKE